MTLDTRARSAAQGIHRAVEVMEMSTYTKEPRKVERFGRYRDRKQRNRRLGAIVVAAALIVAVVVIGTKILAWDDRPVPATPVEPTGTILFADYIGAGIDQLYTIDAGGGRVRQLSVSTDPAAEDWSPDGTKILVTSGAGPEDYEGPLRPATVEADGTGFQLLGATPDPDLNLGCGAWSPDGRLLACEGFGRTRSDGRAGLYLVRASDGGDLERVTHFQAIPLGFSPDGQQILLTRSDVEARPLLLVNVDGSGLHALDPNGFKAVGGSWSPNGRWIVFAHQTAGGIGELYVIHPDGSSMRKITFPPGSGVVAASEPTWSPDGTYIAFQGWRSGQSYPDIYLARADGSDVQRLTHTPGFAEERPDWGPGTT